MIIITLEVMSEINGVRSVEATHQQEFKSERAAMDRIKRNFNTFYKENTNCFGPVSAEELWGGEDTATLYIYPHYTRGYLKYKYTIRRV